MYGLAVNLIMSVSGHPSIINEICILYVQRKSLLCIKSTTARENSPALCLTAHTYVLSADFAVHMYYTDILVLTEK